ncbi:MAG: hemerythrin domain-containing protein [Lacibacter sp.]
MKRDQNLYPLSHQHHNGLMAVLLLEKGVTKNADLKIMNDFILDCWESELENHFIAEEKNLDPSLLQLPQLNDLYDRMISEHELIRNIIDAIKQKQESKELIVSFHTLLENHIRFEERTLFPFIQEHATEASLSLLGKQISHLTNGNCSNYLVKFWE